VGPRELLTFLRASAYVDAVENEPEIGLRAAASLRVLAEQLESLHVARARQMGWSWQEIASCLGITKQAVHRKYAADGRRP
jgi:hypothetical protein